MAVIVGRNAAVAISTDGVTYTTIGKVTSASLTLNTATADYTNNDSSGWTEAAPTDKSGSMSFGFKFDPADSGQEACLAAAGLTRYFRFRPSVGSGIEQWVGQGILTDFTIDTATSEVEDGSGSVTFTGAITESDQ